MNYYFIPFAFVLNCFFLSLAFAEPGELVANAEPDLGNELVEVGLVIDRSSLQPPLSGQGLVGTIGVSFKIKPGWHIYWRNSGEAAIPTMVTWDLPDRWQAGLLNWPAPTKFIEKGGIVTFGYEKKTVLFSKLLSSQTKETPLLVKADVRWLVCKDICVPGRASLSETVEVSSLKPLEKGKDSDLIQWAQSNTPKEMPPTLSLEVDRKFVKPGEEFNLIFRFQSDPILKDFSLGSQVYPLQSKVFSAVEGSSVVGASTLVLPVKVNSGAKPGESPFSGIISLRPDLALALGLDKNFSWEKKILVKGVEEIGSELGGKFSNVAADAELVPLVYNSVAKTADTLPESNSLPAVNLQEQGHFSMVYYLVLAFIGGLLLNFMPCVLPVISIKVCSLVEFADYPFAQRLRKASFFAFGVIVSFLALAIAVIILRNLGSHVGWGFQFQSPWFLVFLSLVVFVFALSFFGLFTVNLPGVSRGFGKESEGPLADIFDGILTTALSTPCTAPFLGTALAFAFLAPDWGILAIFLVIGLGLSTPFFLLSCTNSLTKFLPRPGEWMNTFRQFMGFVLLGTVVWLLSVFTSLSQSGVSYLLSLMLYLAFAFWWVARCSARRSILGFLLFCGFVFLLVLFREPLSQPKVLGITDAPVGQSVSWQKFSEQVLVDAKTAGKPVFIDFTADWCVTCKANERLVIDTPETAKAIEEFGIVAVLADWTTGEEGVSEALKKFGGSGVPHYVVLQPDGRISQVLSSLLTKEGLRNAFKKAASS